MSGVIYPINNKEYTAEDVEIFNCTRTSGVHSVLDFDLSLSGNVLTVGKGLAWIKNADFKGKAVAFTEPETITLDSADSTLDRYDVVAVRYDATKKEPELVVIKGTASENPVIPKRNTESYLYELFLYSILRKAGESTASFENVTDLRENKNYCGIMEDSVTSAVAPVYETLFEYKSGENSVLKVGDTVDFDYSKYQFFIATIDGAFSENDIILTPTEDKTGQNKFTCLIGSNVISTLTGSSQATFYLRAQIKINEVSVTTGHTVQIVQRSNTADFNLENIDNSYITKLVGVTKQPKGYVAVDDIYNPESHNAQSGEAVKQAIDEALENFHVEIPDNIETTDNKVNVIDEKSTETQYPNAKIVYLGFQDLQAQLTELKEYIDILDNSEILDSGKCGENLTWTLRSSGVLRISGVGKSYDYCKGILIGKTREEIEAQVEAGTIPADYAFQEGKTYDDEHGQYVSPWYKYRSEVDFDGYTTEEAYNKENPNGWKYNKILIDPGITYIGDWMFYRVSGPAKLVIPESVTKIGRWGIRYSPTLTTIVLPNSLKEIEYRGLSRNEVVTSITFGNKLTAIGDYGLSMNHTIETIELPETVTSIGINQFEGDTELKKVRLAHITSIPSRTFVSLTSLKDVVIPEEVISIGEYAFYKCTSLERIKIPSNVATIDNNAFYLCENLRDVYIDSQTITDLITDKYSCGYLITNAERVYLKKGIASSFFETGWKYIETVDGYKKYESYETVGGDSIASGYAGASVFYIVEKTEVENEYSLTIDGSGAMTSTTYTAVPWYEYKDNIVSVSVGSGVSNMPANCFREYTNLKTAVVTCETIPNQAFYKCTSLAKVNLTGVKTIGTHAFFTTSLTEIVIPDGVTTIGQYAFSGVSTAVSVTIGKDVVEIGRNVCPHHEGSLIIPEENAIQTIGEQAFSLSQGTGTLNLPVIVTIGDKAFVYNNSFEVINIGSSIESIGAQAFEMNEIATVTINRAEADITIGENAFKKIPAEKLIFVS